MERFAIKIDKSVKARLKTLCRLCGIDNPNQIEILNAAEWIDLTIEGEVSLSRKISDCVGIEVTKNDRMPQKVCALCVDKINDFYEFREMCHATNIQTRKLLNLPNQTKSKLTKKLKIENEHVESILGIKEDEIKPKVNQAQKPTKKSKKNATSSAAASTSNDSRFRGMSKREIEITLELERIKKEEEEEEKNLLVEITSKNRTKNSKKKKLDADGVLLAPKQLNQRERKREIEQKRIEKKRKLDAKTKVPVVKKIKKEPGIACLLCEERFNNMPLRDAHLADHHRPLISEFGCSSCHEIFANNVENNSHHDWHYMFNVPYKCVLCAATFEKLLTFQRHLSMCTHPSYDSTTIFSKTIYCNLCNLDFETQNLHDWHDCIIKNNSPCPNCHRIFIKKTVLMKHMFKCTVPIFGATNSTKKVGRPKKTKNKLVKNKAPQNIKLEPETIIEQSDEDCFDAIDNSFMESHFGDSSNDFDASENMIMTTEPIADATSEINDTIEASSSQAIIRSADNRSISISNIHTNLTHPLLQCHVKLEPLDVSSFTNLTHSSNAEIIERRTPTIPPLVISPPTVPPLTIRIKKEVIQPGYGDEFDPDLARNIKQEKSDEVWELANISRDKSASSANSHKITKNRDNIKKLYKKPALLAIKIKQERMKREENSDEQYNEDYYNSFSMPMDNFSETVPSQPYESNSLPIITQIHSLIVPPSSSIPNINETLLMPPPNLPFVPIRIKSEFKKPLSPPSCDQPENDSLGEVNSMPVSQAPNMNVDIAESSTTNVMNECDTTKLLNESDGINLHPSEIEDIDNSCSNYNCYKNSIVDKPIKSDRTVENLKKPFPLVVENQQPCTDGSEGVVYSDNLEEESQNVKCKPENKSIDENQQIKTVAALTPVEPEAKVSTMTTIEPLETVSPMELVESWRRSHQRKRFHKLQQFNQCRRL